MVTAFVVVIMMALVLVAGLVLDGGLALADQWRLTALSQVVNGAALEGLATRIDYANRFRHSFGVPIPGEPSLVA